MIKEGSKAPDFSLDTDQGQRVSLQDFRDKTLVLFFYPKDSTPGCTREAQAFSAAARAIEAAGGTVMGVSRDSVKSHCSFRDKFGLGIPLASDPEAAAHKAYGAWGDKNMYGKTVTGCIRSTFLVRNGRVVKVFPSVKVDGHADEVLQAIGELAHGPSSGRIPTLPPPAAIKTKMKAVAKKVVAKVKKVAKKTAAKVKKAASPKKKNQKK